MANSPDSDSESNSEDGKGVHPVGVNFRPEQTQRIEQLLGRGHSRSHWIRSITQAALISYDMAQEHGESVAPYEIGEFMTECVRDYLERAE
jgi:hypothetical protein